MSFSRRRDGAKEVDDDVPPAAHSCGVDRRSSWAAGEVPRFPPGGGGGGGGARRRSSASMGDEDEDEDDEPPAPPRGGWQSTNAMGEAAGRFYSMLASRVSEVDCQAEQLERAQLESQQMRMRMEMQMRQRQRQQMEMELRRRREMEMEMEMEMARRREMEVRVRMRMARMATFEAQRSRSRPFWGGAGPSSPMAPSMMADGGGCGYSSPLNNRRTATGSVYSAASAMSRRMVMESASALAASSMLQTNMIFGGGDKNRGNGAKFGQGSGGVVSNNLEEELSGADEGSCARRGWRGHGQDDSSYGGDSPRRRGDEAPPMTSRYRREQSWDESTVVSAQSDSDGSRAFQPRKRTTVSASMPGASSRAAARMDDGAAFCQDGEEDDDEEEEDQEDLPPPPKRQLSAYNYFFQHERARLLVLADQGLRAEDHPPVNLTLKDIKYLLANNPYSTGKNRRKAKSHGKITFMGLVRHISRSWRAVDPTTRAAFERLAREDKLRYRTEMKEYKAEFKRRGLEVPKQPHLVAAAKRAAAEEEEKAASAAARAAEEEASLAEASVAETSVASLGSNQAPPASPEKRRHIATYAAEAAAAAEASVARYHEKEKMEEEELKIQKAKADAEERKRIEAEERKVIKAEEVPPQKRFSIAMLAADAAAAAEASVAKYHREMMMKEGATASERMRREAEIAQQRRQHVTAMVSAEAVAAAATAEAPFARGTLREAPSSPTTAGVKRGASPLRRQTEAFFFREKQVSIKKLRSALEATELSAADEDGVPSPDEWQEPKPGELERAGQVGAHFVPLAESEDDDYEPENSDANKSPRLSAETDTALNLQEAITIYDSRTASRNSAAVETTTTTMATSSPRAVVGNNSTSAAPTAYHANEQDANKQDFNIEDYYDKRQHSHENGQEQLLSWKLKQHWKMMDDHRLQSEQQHDPPSPTHGPEQDTMEDVNVEAPPSKKQLLHGAAGQELLSLKLNQHRKMDDEHRRHHPHEQQHGRPSAGYQHAPEQQDTTAKEDVAVDSHVKGHSHQDVQDLLSWKLRQHWKIMGGGGDRGHPTKQQKQHGDSTADCTTADDDDDDIDMELDDDLFERLDVLDF